MMPLRIDRSVVVLFLFLWTHLAFGQSSSNLVAAYAFEEGTGTTTADASGNRNNGTLQGATWTTNGKFGKAASFNGSNSWITVNDSNSLHLTNAMTLEAWVYPTANQSGWRTIMQKQTDAYFLTASSNDGPLRNAGGGTFNGNVANTISPTGLPVNVWSHVAVTYDGANLRLYVNGSQVSSRSQSGTIQVTTSPLRIGGNSVYGEYFQGYIDEARIYSRADSDPDSDRYEDAHRGYGIHSTNCILAGVYLLKRERRIEHDLHSESIESGSERWVCGFTV